MRRDYAKFYENFYFDMTHLEPVGVSHPLVDKARDNAYKMLIAWADMLGNCRTLIARSDYKQLEKKAIAIYRKNECFYDIKKLITIELLKHMDKRFPKLLDDLLEAGGYFLADELDAHLQQEMESLYQEGEIAVWH